ncbi:MAG: hypothetical protein ACRD2J_05660 [Thermoanaerobaculia bacterium]
MRPPVPSVVVVLAVVSTLAAACALAGDPDIAPAVDAEIARLEAEAGRLAADEALPAGLRNLLPRLRKDLETARSAQSPLLRLYRMRGPAEGLRFRHAGRVKRLLDGVMSLR